MIMSSQQRVGVGAVKASGVRGELLRLLQYARPFIRESHFYLSRLVQSHFVLAPVTFAAALFPPVCVHMLPAALYVLFLPGECSIMSGLRHSADTTNGSFAKPQRLISPRAHARKWKRKEESNRERRRTEDVCDSEG